MDARANEIWRGAEKVRLEPKVMQTLCVLSERLGRVVSREELEAVAWPRAIALDPSLARAYSGLAMVYAGNIVDGWNPRDLDSLNQALELTEKAKQREPSVPRIYFVEGYTELFRRNFEAAIRAAEHSTPSPSSPAMRLRAPRLDTKVRWPADPAGQPKDSRAWNRRCGSARASLPTIASSAASSLYPPSDADGRGLFPGLVNPQINP